MNHRALQTALLAALVLSGVCRADELATERKVFRASLQRNRVTGAVVFTMHQRPALPATAKLKLKKISPLGSLRLTLSFVDPHGSKKNKKKTETLRFQKTTGDDETVETGLIPVESGTAAFRSGLQFSIEDAVRRAVELNPPTDSAKGKYTLYLEARLESQLGGVTFQSEKIRVQFKIEVEEVG